MIVCDSPEKVREQGYCKVCDSRKFMLRKKYTLSELKNLPVLSIGQDADLLIENDDYGIRVWLSRMGIEDGAEYPNQVEIETLRNGSWEIYTVYEGKEIYY